MTGAGIELGRIIDELPALIWTSLPDGHCDFLNQRWFEYTDLDRATALGWGWQIVIHPDDRENMLETWRLIRASGEAQDLEARIRRHDGVYRWFLFRTCPIKDDSGRILKWCGMNTDIEERKQEEKLLTESEQRFRAIFDEAGAGMALADLTPGVPIKTNLALQSMLGCSEDELGRYETYNDLTWDADRAADAATFQELYDGRRDRMRMEKHFVRSDGRSIWANVIFTLLRNSDQVPRYIIAIHEDITERKRVVLELQERDDLLALAQKAARAMAFDWHFEKEVNTWSPEQEALYGLAPGTFDGTFESWKATIHPNDWPLVVKDLKRAHETGDISSEYRVVWPDGSLHWLSANGQMFFDNGGKPLRMVGFTADITPRKLAEERLRRNEAFLAEAQHLTRIGSFSWRLDNGEIMWSDQLYRIFEFEPDTPMTLEQIASRVHPEDVPLLHDMVERAGQAVSDFEYEHRLRLPDQSVKYVHLIAHLARDKDWVEYIGAVQDVTERKLGEEALGKARSELAHVARANSLSALTASIAHEVNQPLAGIITNASTCLRMLAAEPPNIDGARETVRRTIRDGNRVSDVIIRLRSLFVKKEVTEELINLNETTGEVIALSRSDLQSSGIILKQELLPDLPSVAGDRIQLQQVILNLLLNASQAMTDIDDRPRDLVIRTGLDEAENVLLTVKDTGVGFNPDNASRLFDAFYTTKKNGMGIGLHVSRSIIEGHRGRLWAAANDGPGATFSLSIPRAIEGVAGVTSLDPNSRTNFEP